jgi:hypothetical protein
MEEKTIDEMIQAFIDNGLDLSYFKFVEDYDKENFFMMYTDLFESMMKEDEDYSFELTDDKDLNISLHGEEMFLYVVDDYQTLRCRLGRGYYDRENTNQVLMLTILFLTVKELKAMIDMFAEEILNNLKDKGNGKFGKLTKLPKNFVGKANHIASRQEEIMDFIEEAREKVTIKEIK